VHAVPSCPRARRCPTPAVSGAAGEPAGRARQQAARPARPPPEPQLFGCRVRAGRAFLSCRKKSPRATSSATRRARPVLGAGRPLGPARRYQPKRPPASSASARNRSPFSMYSVTSTVWPSCRQAPTNLRTLCRTRVRVTRGNDAEQVAVVHELGDQHSGPLQGRRQQTCAREQVRVRVRVRVGDARRSSPPPRATRTPPGVGAGRGAADRARAGRATAKAAGRGTAALGARLRAECAAAERGRPRGAGADGSAQRGAHCTMLRSWQERSRKISRRQASASGPALALTDSWSQ